MVKHAGEGFAKEPPRAGERRPVWQTPCAAPIPLAKTRRGSGGVRVAQGRHCAIYDVASRHHHRDAADRLK